MSRSSLTLLPDTPAVRVLAVSLSTAVMALPTTQAAHPEGVQEPWDGGVCCRSPWRGQGARQRKYHCGLAAVSIFPVCFGGVAVVWTPFQAVFLYGCSVHFGIDHADVTDGLVANGDITHPSSCVQMVDVSRLAEIRLGPFHRRPSLLCFALLCFALLCCGWFP